MRLPQGSPPGLPGISRGFPQISLAPLLLPPAGHCLHCVVPLGHRPGRVLRLSCGTQVMSLVPLPYRVFSEIAIWPFFVAHFFIRSRQEFHGVWAETSPRNFFSQFSFSPLPHHRDFWGSSFFLAQASQSLTESASVFPVSLPGLRRLAHILEWTGSGSLQEMRFCSRTQKDLVSSFSTCPSWRCDLG